MSFLPTSVPLMARVVRTVPGWAIANQATVSLGNFASNLLLAKMLSPSEYGTFVLICGGCFMANALHSSVILAPMMVTSAAADEDDMRRCAAGSLLLTPITAAVFAVMVIAVAFMLRRPVAGLFAVGFMLAWQMQETTRRVLLSRFRYRDATWGDAFSYIGQALAIAVLCWVHALSLERVLLLMAATSALAALGQAIQSKLIRISKRDLHELAARYWSFGKWLLVATVVGATVGQLPLWTLAANHGREQAAAFQALLNILGVTHPILLTISAIVLPATAAAMASGAESSKLTLARRLGSHYIWQFELLIAPVLLAYAIWPAFFLRVLYGASSPYVHLEVALRIMVVAYVLTVPAFVLATILTGIADARGNAIVQIGSAIVAIVVIVPGSLLFGLIGAITGDTICRASRVAISCILVGRTQSNVLHRWLTAPIAPVLLREP